MKNIEGFLSKMTPMQKGKAEKTLKTKRRYNDGIKTDAEIVEKYIQLGRNFRLVKEPNAIMRQLKFEHKPKQWEYIKSKEKARESQYRDFVQDEYESPIAEYFKTGNTDNLPSSVAKTKYIIDVGDNLIMEISKTMYDYAQYLMNDEN